jgi:DNA-binding LacI/PurR family transcriptional regulator
LQRAGLSLQDDFVIMAGQNPEDGERAMNQLLLMPHPPTAVFTRTDELAVGALRAARKQGVPVPERLSIIGHDDLTFTQFMDPPLSTVRVNCDKVGQAATTILLSLIDSMNDGVRPLRSHRSCCIQTELVRRETIGLAWDYGHPAM